MRALFHQVPVLDTGARGATNSFAQRDLGDVLLAWENEAWLARKEFGADALRDRLSVAEHSGRTAGSGGGQRRRQEGHARAGASLSGVSLYAAGAGYHRAQLLPPTRPGGGGAIRRALSHAEPRHDRGFRRLGRGPGEVSSPMEACSTASTPPENDRGTTFRITGLRSGLDDHARLDVADCPGAAGLADRCAHGNWGSPACGTR